MRQLSARGNLDQPLLEKVDRLSGAIEGDEDLGLAQEGAFVAGFELAGGAVMEKGVIELASQPGDIGQADPDDGVLGLDLACQM